MANPDSHVTIHMAASLDGFIARKDGRVDWLETSDEFVGGDTMDPGFVEAFLKTIDCYVMGSRTYEKRKRGHRRLPSQRLKRAGAAILVFRASIFLQAAPAV
jgi:dihydrofolate reductase